MRCSARWYAHHPTFALGGKRQTGPNVVARQLREIGEKLLLAHSGGKVREHVSHGDARTPHAWFSEANFGVYDDPILVIHRL
jgi:hypothetical protein